MKTAYLDCTSGISGDMMLAAFLDAGFKLDILKQHLANLNLKGYKISKRVVTRHHLKATKLDIQIEKDRAYEVGDIEKIIRKSKVDKKIKEMSLEVFNNLCEAEKKIHRSNELHLHELGNLDTILDIVGVCACLIEWDIKNLYFSNLTFGKGLIKGKSGILPSPAPATLELLKNMPAKFSQIESELVTPTGAAILSTLARFTEEPIMKVERIGYGAGLRDLDELPNVLRLMVGEEKPSYLRDTVMVLETAIDDTMPIVYTYIYEELMERGALDVYLTNIYMKKNRPGQLLTVIIPNHLLSEISEFIFRETNTIGLRYYRVDRFKLHRRSKEVKTKYGKVSVKLSGTKDEVFKAMPEFESCKRLAQTKGIPLVWIYEEAKKAAVFLLLFIFTGLGMSFCDTIYLKDEKELKGIIVEAYKDRIVISTEHGETEIKGIDIKTIDYDLPEQNLVALGNRYRETGNFSKAYFYYDRARKINPEFKEAIDGVNYMEGFLFRKEMGLKSKEIDWRQDVEDFHLNKSAKKEESFSKVKALIGVELEEDKRDIKVTKVYKDSPADVAHIKEGDAISSIWGRLTGYMSSEEVSELLTRPEHLELKIQIDRKIKIEPHTTMASQLDLKFEGLSLTNISEGSKAFVAGLKNDDILMAIDGNPIRYTPLREVLKTLEEETRTLSVRREIAIWRKR